MARTADITVSASDLPAVKASLTKAAETISNLRALLQAWEPRVRCPQCGARYEDRACGPAHASVSALVWPQGGDVVTEPPVRSDRHTVTLASTGATTTHPTACDGTTACRYAEAAQRLPVHMLAIGGTWTTGLADDGTLIILARIA